LFYNHWIEIRFCVRDKDCSRIDDFRTDTVYLTKTVLESMILEQKVFSLKHCSTIIELRSDSAYVTKTVLESMKLGQKVFSCKTLFYNHWIEIRFCVRDKDCSRIDDFRTDVVYLTKTVLESMILEQILCIWQRMF